MYTEHDLVRVAKRDNNKKRNYLVVNRLQGKHIPVSPKQAFAMFDVLAGQVGAAFGGQPLLLIGFAETATAIGARLAIKLGANYMQTTRESVGGVEYLYFTESHSHATEQKLVKEDVEAMVGRAGRIVFVEDEVTTGNTILHIIDILERRYPGKFKFAVASILNGMGEQARNLYAKRGITLFYLVKTDHQAYAARAEECLGDGRSFALHQNSEGKVSEYRAPGYVNARRVTQGRAYARACASLWDWVKASILPERAQKMLLLGTEEFMYPALSVGECLERCGHTVKCHATTRSPIVASQSDAYPLHTRYELRSFYDEQRTTFVYNLEPYDRVWIFTDAAGSYKAGVDSLVGALLHSGNDKIQLVRWCKV